MSAEYALMQLEQRLLRDGGVGAFLDEVRSIRKAVAMGDDNAVRRALGLTAPLLEGDALAALGEAYEIGAEDGYATTGTKGSVLTRGAPSAGAAAPARGLDSAGVQAFQQMRELARAGAAPDAVLSPLFKHENRIRGSISDAVNRSGNEGTTAVADEADLPTVWVAETNACVHCLRYSGVVAKPGKSFPGGLTYGWKSYYPDALATPPRHPRCRCTVEPLNDQSYADALRREADRSVLRGFSLESESMSARLDAAAKLLEDGVDAPKSVIAFSVKSIKAGEFPTRGRSTTPPPPPAENKPPTVPKPPKPPKSPKADAPKAETTKTAAPERKFVDKILDDLKSKRYTPEQYRAAAKGQSEAARANVEAAIAEFKAKPPVVKATPKPPPTFTPAKGSGGLPPLTTDQLDALQPKRGGWTTKTSKGTLAILGTTPAGRSLAKVLKSFQSGSAAAIPRLRTDIETYLMRGELPEGRRDNIEKLLGAINSSPVPDGKGLFRGMIIPGGVDDVLKRYGTGDAVDFSLASFTSDKKTAFEFSRIGAGQRIQTKRNTAVVVEMVGDDRRALPIENISPSSTFWQEREWVASGQYKVTGTKVIKKDGVDTVVVTVEGVGQWQSRSSTDTSTTP